MHLVAPSSTRVRGEGTVGCLPAVPDVCPGPAVTMSLLVSSVFMAWVEFAAEPEGSVFAVVWASCCRAGTPHPAA
jgi:hypothetical protein